MAIYKHVLSGPLAAGDVWTSGLHTSGIGTLAAAHAAFMAFVSGIGGASGLGPLWSTNTAIREVRTYSLNLANGKATGVARGSVTINGTGAANAAAPRDCIVIGLRTANPGKSGIGRMYLPGVTPDLLSTTGLIEDIPKTTAAGVMAANLNDLGDAGYVPVVWSVANPAGFVITGVTVAATQGTQRRRSNKIPASYAAASVV